MSAPNETGQPEFTFVFDLAADNAVASAGDYFTCVRNEVEKAEQSSQVTVNLRQQAKAAFASTEPNAVANTLGLMAESEQQAAIAANHALDAMTEAANAYLRACQARERIASEKERLEAQRFLIKH